MDTKSESLCTSVLYTAARTLLQRGKYYFSLYLCFYSFLGINFSKLKEFADRKLTFKQFSSVFDAVEAKPKMITLGEMPKDFVLSDADIKALHKYVHQGGFLLANLKKDSPKHGSADSLLTRFIPGGK